MPQLSPAGQSLVHSLAQKHGFSDDAVTHMMIAVQNGCGTMAQFSHPEFAGSGQWMAGGMIMLGDMFNGQLKYRVDGLCQDLASELSRHQCGTFSGSFQSQSQNGIDNQAQFAGGVPVQNSLFVPDPRQNWWPAELGNPSASGSQNTTRYAYFSHSNRLAVATGDDVWVYDTLNHQIGGFSQQQSGDGSITFTSQFGVIPLSSLPVVSRNGNAVPPPTPEVASPPASTAIDIPAAPAAPSQAPNASVPGNDSADSILTMIERLGGLLEKGLISQNEFDTKKADLLSRL